MKNAFLLLLILLFGYTSYSQEVTCKDFKKGTFILTSDQLPELEWTIKRTKRKQKEFLTKFPKGVDESKYDQRGTYGKLIWIGLCEYKLIYTQKREALSEFQLSVNENGGVTTTLLTAKGKCFRYASSFTANGLSLKGSGEICKVK